MAITSITGNSKIFNNLNSFCSLSVTGIKTHVPISSLCFRPNSYGYYIKSTRRKPLKMLRLKRVSSAVILNSRNYFSREEKLVFPIHLSNRCRLTSNRFLDIYQLGNKEAIEKERARLLSSNYGSRRASEHVFRVPMISCVVEDTSETQPESGNSSASSDSSKEAAINLKLPRRSLLVTFTCNACGVRSQRLINRLAYERGTVFIQCSGCSQYHKFVDNLGLVVEYNFKDEINMDPDADQD